MMSKVNEKFNTWVDNHSDYLFNFAYYRVDDRDMAKDLVQETFLAAYKGFSNFQGKSSEKTWLTSILKRKIYDHYKEKSKKQNTNSIAFFEEEGKSQGMWNHENAPKDVNFGAKQMDNEELKKIIAYCLSLLPPKAASVFKLKNVLHYDSEVICNELEISKSNYWVLTHRAKLLMRSCLEDKWLN
ncbi:MAG: sigma-70 family RNA polymerase sigma factor [Flavobacteriales bacterium]|nr:sigma-70 family RNA polymerase sigma factor [Flavobacteriales bacterium]